MARESNGVRYSKKIVLLCLIVMTVLLAVDTVLCWQAGEQLDSASVAAMAAFWGTEVFSSAWIRVTETKQSKKTETKQEEP